MKILSRDGDMRIGDHFSDSRKTQVSIDPACIFDLDGDNLKICHYSSEFEISKAFHRADSTYRKITSTKTKVSRYVNTHDKDDEYLIPEEFDMFMEYSSPVDDIDSHFVDYDSGYTESSRERGLFLCNIGLKKKVALPLAALRGIVCEEKERVYLLDEKKNRCVAGVDFSGEVVWRYDFNFVRPYNAPFVYNNLLVKDGVVYAYSGPKSLSERDGEFSGKVFQPHDGLLVAIDDESGDQVWSLNLENGLIDMICMDDCILLISGSSLMAVNKRDGTLDHEIDLGICAFYWNGGFSSPDIFSDEQYLYISSPRDRKLLIVDSINYTLIRTLELPAGMKVGTHSYTDPQSGRHYFKLLIREDDLASHPLLELNPNDIHAQLTYENSPDHSVSVEGDEEGGKKIVITMEASTLEELIKFGEIYTRREAKKYSTSSLRGMPLPEKDFNGLIHLRVFGLNGLDGLHDILKVMQARFDAWSDSAGCYSCTHVGRPATLATEIVDRNL